MADFTKLMADNAAMAVALADLSTKVDALLAKTPVDDQPTVDAVDTVVEQNLAAVAAIAAKIPA